MHTPTARLNLVPSTKRSGVSDSFSPRPQRLRISSKVFAGFGEAPSSSEARECTGAGPFITMCGPFIPAEPFMPADAFMETGRGGIFLSLARHPLKTCVPVSVLELRLEP